MPFGISYTCLQICPTASKSTRFSCTGAQSSHPAVQSDGLMDGHTDRQAAYPPHQHPRAHRPSSHTSAPAPCPRDGNHNPQSKAWIKADTVPGRGGTELLTTGTKAPLGGPRTTHGTSDSLGGTRSSRKNSEFSLPLQSLQLFFFSVFAFCCNISMGLSLILWLQRRFTGWVIATSSDCEVTSSLLMPSARSCVLAIPAHPLPNHLAH